MMYMALVFALFSIVIGLGYRSNGRVSEDSRRIGFYRRVEFGE